MIHRAGKPAECTRVAITDYDRVTIRIENPKDRRVEQFEELRSELEVSLLSQKRVDREILDKRQVPALLERSPYYAAAGVSVQRPSCAIAPQPTDDERLRTWYLLRSETSKHAAVWQCHRHREAAGVNVAVHRMVRTRVRKSAGSW